MGRAAAGDSVMRRHAIARGTDLDDHPPRESSAHSIRHWHQQRQKRRRRELETVLTCPAMGTMNEEDFVRTWEDSSGAATTLRRQHLHRAPGPEPSLEGNRTPAQARLAFPSGVYPSTPTPPLKEGQEP